MLGEKREILQSLNETVVNFDFILLKEFECTLHRVQNLLGHTFYSVDIPKKF